MVKMRADYRIRFPTKAARNEFGKRPPIFGGYFFEGDDWDDIVCVERDETDERLKILLGVGYQVL